MTSENDIISVLNKKELFDTDPTLRFTQMGVPMVKRIQSDKFVFHAQVKKTPEEDRSLQDQRLCLHALWHVVAETHGTWDASRCAIVFEDPEATLHEYFAVEKALHSSNCNRVTF